MSARAGVQRVSRPRRRSRRSASPGKSRRLALERLLGESDLLVRHMLHDVRERHPLEAAPGGMDMEDRVQANLAREIDATLLERQSEVRRTVEDALRRPDRLDDAACTRCGEPIGRARLRAVPFTEVCRACKDAEEEGERSAAAPRSLRLTG